MVSASQIMMIMGSLLALLSYSSAFWFTAEEPKPSSARMLYQPPDYYRQYAPLPPPYTIPLQVPLPAQISPAAIQNVQLVPCLCPVSQEYSYENSHDYVTRKAQYAQAQQAAAQQRRK